MSLERVDKILAKIGVGSRKDVKKFCRQGLVTVNGLLVKDSGQKIDPDKDELAFDGQVLHYREFIYLMLNKPVDVVSATEDNLHRTVLDLLGEEEQVFEPFPVGRLDIDTEGLLLLTNDGQLAHRLLSPKRAVPKTYYVEVSEPLSESDYAALEAGVTLDDGYETLPAQVQGLKSLSDIENLNPEIKGLIKEESKLLIAKGQALLLTITEGKFHQVKRMIQAVGSQVIYLQRIRMGPLFLDENLPLGSYRELRDDELEKIKSYNSNQNN